MSTNSPTAYNYLRGVTSFTLGRLFEARRIWKDPQTLESSAAGEGIVSIFLVAGYLTAVTCKNLSKEYPEKWIENEELSQFFSGGFKESRKFAENDTPKIVI